MPSEKLQDAKSIRKFLLLSYSLTMSYQKEKLRGACVVQLAKCLPYAQVLILGSWDQYLCWALCSEGSVLLPLPLSPACLLPQINKFKKSFKMIFLKKRNYEKHQIEVPGWLAWLRIWLFWFRSWFQGSGIKPTLGSMLIEESASDSLSLSLSLCPSLLK